MPERDGYIPGVPCWIDTSQPDPEAAVDFYSGLFGWEFEDVMPPELAGQVLHRAASAAATSPPSARSPRARRRWRCGTPTSGSRAPTRPPSKVRDAGGSVADGAVRRHGRRAGWRCSPIPRARCSASGRRRSTRARGSSTSTARLNFNGLNTRDAGRREGVLRRGVRLGDAGARRRRRDVDAARLRRPPRGATTPASASRWPRWARPAGFEDVVASINPIPRRPAGRPAALERDVRGRRRRRHRREGGRARRQGDRPAVRRPVGAG